METGKLLTFDTTKPLNRQPNKEGRLRRRLIHSDILKKTMDYLHKADLLSQKSYRRQLHPGLVSSITHR